MNPSRHVCLLLAAALVVAALAAPAGAQRPLGVETLEEEPSVVVEVRHALGRIHRMDGLVVAAASLENPSDDDRTITLEWEVVGATGRRVVEMPAHSRKEATLYLGPAERARAYQVVARDEQGEMLNDVMLTSVPVMPGEVSVGIVGSHHMGWSELRGSKGIKVVNLRADELPGRAEGLASLDLLVWSDPLPASLRPDQVRAIARWTSGGGCLVLALNDVWYESSGGAHLPWTGIRALGIFPAKELPSLEPPTSHPFGPLRSPVTVARLSSSGGEVWLRERPGPIAVVERRDLGHVVVLGFDPSEGPVAGWRGIGPFWQAVLAKTEKLPPLVEAPRYSGYWGRTDARVVALNLLTNLEEIEPPSLGFLAAVLLVYLLAIGPVDYFVLKRFRRLSWTWFTFPALVLLFAVGTQTVARVTKTADIGTQRILVRDLLPSADTFAEELHVAIFATDAGEHTIDAGEEGGIALVPPRPREDSGAAPWALELRGASVADQGAERVTAYLPRWAPLSATFLRHVPAGGAGVEADLVLDGDQVRGQVEPHLGFDLRRAWVLVSFRGEPYLFHLGPLSDGVPAVFEPRSGIQVSDNPQLVVVSDPRNDLLFYGHVLTLQTVRRLARGELPEEGDWDGMSRWDRLYHDPQPRNDWSAHLEEGGVVLLGVVRESERWTTDEGNLLGGDEGITFVRVPLSPEVLTR